METYALSSDVRRELLDRILKSKQFRRSERQRAFLAFVCERVLAGKAEEINESSVGTQVFQRPPGFNRSEDAIVRVEARLLRNRLEAYFKGEGQAEPIVLQIPTGTYVPVFAERTPPPVPPAEVAAVPISAVPAASVNPENRIWIGASRPARTLAAATLLALALSLAANAFLWTGHAKEDEQPAGSLWTELFSPAGNMQVVLGDACARELQASLGRTLTLNEYLQAMRLPRGASAPGAIPTLQGCEHTTFGDASLAFRLASLRGNAAHSVSVKFARNVEMRDFKGDSFILLGGPRSNPWVLLFEGGLNFTRGFDKHERGYIHNRSPKEGESTDYVDGGADEHSGPQHAAIAFVPNLEGRGGVLILAGTTMISMEAAGEFLGTPAALNNIRSALKRPNGTLPYFELVLRTSQVGSVGRDTSVIATRIVGERPQ